MATYIATDTDGAIQMSSAEDFSADIKVMFPRYSFSSTTEAVEYGYDGGLYVASALPVDPDADEKARAAMRRAFTDAIQRRLDDFARTRGYDNIMSAAAYATSTVPKFQIEGQYAVEARDAAWAKGYEIMNTVLAGERPMPAMEDVFAELPALKWPEVKEHARSHKTRESAP